MGEIWSGARRIDTDELTRRAQQAADAAQQLGRFRLVEADRARDPAIGKGEPVQLVEKARRGGGRKACDGEDAQMLAAKARLQALGVAAVADEEARSQVVLDVNEETVMAVARGWSIDPTTLSGEVPGHALLFDDVDEGPPPPAQVEAPSRTPWLWSKLVRRRT